MSDISPAAAARRDAARVNGRFGEQEHTAPEVTIMLTGNRDEHESKSTRLRHEPGDPVSAGTLEAGDEVLTETNTTDSPFGFALRRDRELRRRWRAAGMPAKLTVLSRRRATDDGHTDDEVTFDLNGEPVALTFHRERLFTIAG